MTDSHDGFRDLSAIGDMFRSSVAHMKSGFPAWEEFVARGMKFQKHFEQMMSSFNGFIDSLYKISELAHNTKGGTYEIGTGLINLAMWHRGQEMKLKEMNTALMTKLLGPLQVKVEEWKKTTMTLEREHDKELQKSIKDIKEAAKSAMKTGKSLESKMKKDKVSDKTSSLHQQLEHYHHETDRHLKETEDRERKNLHRVLLEERSWFCGFVNAFTRVLDVETGMLVDLERLQAILKDLATEVSHPAILPETTREMVETWTIPASPASLHNKISTAPSMISVSSGSSGDSGGPVISGPIMTNSTALGGSPVGIPIQPHPPTPPNVGVPPPSAPPTGMPRPGSGEAAGFVPPPPPMNIPQPPPTAPPTSAQPMGHTPPGPRPPPPTTAPPPSSQPLPLHSLITLPTSQPSRSQTLPRNFTNYRGMSMDRGIPTTNSSMLNPTMNHHHYNNVPAPQGGGVPNMPNGDYIQNRSLPPPPPGEDPYLPMNSVVVLRPGLVPSASATLPRSLPPMDSRISPTNTQLFTIEEPSIEGPSSLQEQLVSRLRGRSQSIEARAGLAVAPDNVYSLPSFSSPGLVRASNSVSGKASVPPPVSSKPSRPPAVAHKPSRPANGHDSPGHSFNQPQVFTQSLDGYHGPPFSAAGAVSSSPTADLDLNPDDDNMFARALRERKLRSVQTNDRSNPVVGR